jgi:hypothetical protein
VRDGWKQVGYGGQTDNVAVDVAQVKKTQNRRNHSPNHPSTFVICCWVRILILLRIRKQVGSSSWKFMAHDYGPAWSTSQAPPGPLQLRLSAGAGERPKRGEKDRWGTTHLTRRSAARIEGEDRQIPRAARARLAAVGGVL